MSVLTGTLVAERLLYLPSIGFLIARCLRKSVQPLAQETPETLKLLIGDSWGDHWDISEASGLERSPVEGAPINPKRERQRERERARARKTHGRL